MVQLHFLNFDLGASSNCDAASVNVYDGNNGSAPLLQTLCGQRLPDTVTSSGNAVFVEFKIDNVVTYTGFKIYYTGLTQVEGMATLHLHTLYRMYPSMFALRAGHNIYKLC